MSDHDSLDFIRDIRVAQFWREKLGDDGYQRHDPKDLRRWYEAMDLMGADDLRTYVIERNSRFPMPVVTGLVSAAPHPPRALVDIWLDSHAQHSYTTQVLGSVSVFLVGAFLLVTNINGCQNAKAPNQPQQFLPQAAVLQTAANNGTPPMLSTLPTSLPGRPFSYVQPYGISVQGYQPTANNLTAQPGNALANSGGAQVNFSASTIQPVTGMPGGALTRPASGVSQPGASAFSPSAASSASMHTANSVPGASAH